MLPIICSNVLIFKNFLGFKDEGNFERFLFRIFITESLKLFEFILGSYNFSYSESGFIDTNLIRINNLFQKSK